MDRTTKNRLNQLAATQHGLLTHRQATDLGMTRSAWRHAVASGGWEPVTDRVLRRSGSPNSLDQRLLAAALDAGPSAYLSHQSGGGAWQVPGFAPEPVEVIVLRDGKEVETPLATVHRPRHLPDPFGTTIRGLPVVRPALLLLQLAPLVSPDRLHRCLDHLWSRRLLSGPSVAAELASVMHRGRPGTAVLRELLDSLPPDYVPTASALEGRVDRILRSEGLPPFRRQVDLGDGDRWCGRIDFLDPELPVVLEVDGDAFHQALVDRADDARRQERLEAAGFTVVRVSEHEVWHRADAVVDRVRDARRVAYARRAAAA